MTSVLKTWVGFKQFYQTAHRELRETSDLAIEESGMHHANIVLNVVTGLQKVLQQEQAPTDNPTIIPEPVDHVVNKVQSTQQQLVTQLQ